jgi:hypothetical protein
MSEPSLSGETAGNQWALRLGVLLLTALETLYLLPLFALIVRHHNPQGGGMEFVAIGAWIMFIYLPLVLPATILAIKGRHLTVAAGLAVVGAIAEFWFWTQILGEMKVTGWW